MSKELPANIKSQIRDDLLIEWWGRRAFYEFVEELNDSLFWLANFWLVAYFFLSLVLNITLSFWIGFVCISILILSYAYWEIEKWSHEVYVVGRDEAGGGAIYKFTGVFSIRYVETPITKSNPMPTVEQHAWYRFWGKLTGEHMERVYLKSDAGIFLLEGQRIHPNFKKAIDRVKGAKALKQGDTSPLWMDLDGLGRSANYGIISKEKARHYADIILDKYVIGD